MLKERGKRISAILLSLVLFTGPVPQAVFAQGETYSVSYEYTGSLPQAVMKTLPEDTNKYPDQTEVTAKTPTRTKVIAGDKKYNFEGWDQNKKVIDGDDITFTGTWESSDIEYKIEGTVYQYPFSSSESSATPKSGVTVKISLNNGTKTVTSGSNGKFSYVFTDAEERTTSGKYAWAIDSNSEHYSSSGTITEGSDEEPVSNKLYMEERYDPQASDYLFTESDKVKKIGDVTWVKEPGEYQIEGISGKKLSKTLDGNESATLDVNVGTTGNVENFFIYINHLCSKILTGQTVRVDSGAPEITEVSTEAATSTTFVKEHGIYSTVKAEIILNATIIEESIVKEAYLISEKGGEQKRYDATKIEGEEGKYTAVIGLPDQETIMDAQLVKLVAVDIFGNKSTEVLIAQSEEGSKVTLEQIAPKLEKKSTGKCSEYNWYSEKPTLSAAASDNLSGLASLEIYRIEKGSEYSVARETYKDKTTTEHTVQGLADFSEITDDGKYTFTAKAVDNAGNETIKNIDVFIDLVAPSIAAEGAENGVHYKTTPVIKVSETEKYYNAKGNRIFVKVTRDGKDVLNETYEQVKEVTVPTGTFNADGVYTVSLSAKDAADNASNTITYKFTKDATAPKVSISGVSEGKYYNKRQTVTVTVVEKNWASNNVAVSAIRKLGGATRNVGFPWKNKSVTTSNSTSYGETGTYTVTASATDKAGNKSTTRKVSFTVDTKAPVITITGVQDGGIYKYGQGLNPNATVTDDYLDSKGISFTKGGVAIANPSFEQIKENDGVYTMTVTARDKAGNTSTKTITFTVNRFGSYFVYNDAIKQLMGKSVQHVDKDLVITEKNVSKVIETRQIVLRDGKAIESPGTTRKNEGGAEKIYTHTFAKGTFEPEGEYEVNVISKDEVGNEMESKAENGIVKFFVDRTAPELRLAGIDPKGNKAEEITVYINASDLLTGVSDIKAYVNGETVFINENDDKTISFTVGKGLNQKVRVTAVDGAGNEAEVTETASVSTNAASLFLNRFLVPVIVAVVGILAALFILIFRKKNKKNGEPAPEVTKEPKE